VYSAARFVHSLRGSSQHCNYRGSQPHLWPDSNNSCVSARNAGGKCASSNMFRALQSNSPLSAPRDDTARAVCGNGAKSEFLSFQALLHYLFVPMISPEPNPFSGELTRWERWRTVVYVAVSITILLIATWHYPALRKVVLPILLGLGFLFDALSAVAYISTYITGRFSSGFLGVGFLCYFLVWLSFPSAVLVSTPTELHLLWLSKLLDLFALFILSLCFHFPFGLLIPKKNKTQASATSDEISQNEKTKK
jgi:hypothetical protein